MTSWSSEATDTITTRADGPTCAQAVVTFVARNGANGDPLWAFASTYYDLTMGGVPPDGAPAVSQRADGYFPRPVGRDVTEQTSELPEWREGVATLIGKRADVRLRHAIRSRDLRNAARAQFANLMCYAAAVEASQCLLIDPRSHAPIMIVAYGP
jgi:hypothetical protein